MAIVIACVVIGILIPVILSKTNAGPTEDEREYMQSVYGPITEALETYEEFRALTGENAKPDDLAWNEATAGHIGKLESIKTDLSAVYYPANLREANDALRDFIGHLTSSAYCHVAAAFANHSNDWTTEMGELRRAKAEHDEATAALNLFMSLADQALHGS